MKSKKRNTNILILQNQIKRLSVKEIDDDEKIDMIKQPKTRHKITGSGVDIIPVIEKVKKKGIPKDELINTKRLLTM